MSAELTRARAAASEMLDRTNALLFSIRGLTRPRECGWDTSAASAASAAQAFRDLDQALEGWRETMGPHDSAVRIQLRADGHLHDMERAGMPPTIEAASAHEFARELGRRLWCLVADAATSAAAAAQPSQCLRQMQAENIGRLMRRDVRPDDILAAAGELAGEPWAGWLATISRQASRLPVLIAQEHARAMARAAVAAGRLTASADVRTQSQGFAEASLTHPPDQPAIAPRLPLDVFTMGKIRGIVVKGEPFLKAESLTPANYRVIDCLLPAEDGRTVGVAEVRSKVGAEGKGGPNAARNARKWADSVKRFINNALGVARAGFTVEVIDLDGVRVFRWVQDGIGGRNRADS